MGSTGPDQFHYFEYSVDHFLKVASDGKRWSKNDRVKDHIHPSVHPHSLVRIVAVNSIVEAPVLDGDLVFGN